MKVIFFLVLTIVNALDVWTEHQGINCYSGHGGTAMDSSDTPFTGMNLEQCENKCASLSGCVAIVVEIDGWRSGYCWVRSAVTVSQCESTRWRYNTYTKVSASPTPASPSSWQEHIGINCYPGHGGTAMDSSDTPFTGMNLEQCENKCASLSGCVAIVVEIDGSKSDYCWVRSAVTLMLCQSSHGKFNTYTKAAGPPTPAPPPTPITPGRKAFIVLGDWGYDTRTHGSNINPGCQRAVAAKMKQFHDANNAQFIINVGDNFYPSGVSSVTDSQWTTKWKNVYDQSLLDLPWFSVLGNHDLGWKNKDCICGSGESGCVQINPPNMDGWFMPSLNYYDTRYLAEGIEIVALDTNFLWANEICKYISCGNCVQVLKTRMEQAFSLLESRIEQSTAKTLLVFSHYPTDYFPWKGFPEWIGLLNSTKHKIVYYGGHRHNVDDTSTFSISPNINWLSGGGGGWGCDGKQQGFMAGFIENGVITTSPQLVPASACCYSGVDLTEPNKTWSKPWRTGL